MLVDSLGSNYCKVRGSDEDIKLVTTDCKVLVAILRNIHGITLGFDVGKELVFSDESFHGLNGVVPDPYGTIYPVNINGTR